MPLNPVQVRFVTDVCRPMIERIIYFRSQLDAFVLAFDNQQNPLPGTGVSLEDATGGTTPRVDVPTLTGAQTTALRNFCLTMRDQITPASLNTLINVSARDLESILRDRR